MAVEDLASSSSLSEESRDTITIDQAVPNIPRDLDLVFPSADHLAESHRLILPVQEFILMLGTGKATKQVGSIGLNVTKNTNMSNDDVRQEGPSADQSIVGRWTVKEENMRSVFQSSGWRAAAKLGSNSNNDPHKIDLRRAAYLKQIDGASGPDS
ncbi:uncharacterized protein BO95DRAFT_465249 [Aspergillus brunneoviolaceus CBS 621.78]|uniref:Uncharacterized protein n=1 Tax=Aspergillus brunneoviolaceus CBS 621.78 TaxID=1450534 RepID=A0ACD1G4G7_9EURO|nr:hypothetical protein BO95DRAFT_465249 [Aspergillus brunneoviolaceus CBS 621.78]RAH44121.1 hypothetical protein BO95DRAFT_465249 [Aspergillus brunneoviolaceus CBS 621.78]